MQIIQELYDALDLPAHLDAALGGGYIRIFHTEDPCSGWYVSQSSPTRWEMSGEDGTLSLEELRAALAGIGVAISLSGPPAEPEPAPEPTPERTSVLIARRDFLAEISAHLGHAAERHEDWVRSAAVHGPDWLRTELVAIRADALRIRASEASLALRRVTEALASREEALVEEARALRIRLLEVEEEIRAI